MWQSHLSDTKIYTKQPIARAFYSYSFKPRPRRSTSLLPIPESAVTPSSQLSPTLTNVSSTSPLTNHTNTNTNSTTSTPSPNPRTNKSTIPNPTTDTNVDATGGGEEESLMSSMWNSINSGTTSGVKSIEGTSSHAVATDNNTPGSASKTWSQDQTSAHGNNQGVESEQFREGIADQGTEPSMPGKAFDSLNGTNHTDG